MKALIYKKLLGVQAVATVALLYGMSDAQANDFNTISENIVHSISELPGLLSGLAYIVGLLLGALGILKVKDHVENPGSTPLKDGAIRIAAGGALFGLPIVFEAMRNTIGDVPNTVGAATMNPIELNVR
ncbi:MAG: hypothetical protein H6868_09175 [Rhodospirillales bacterium]|nr:hypothetical protein [Rhodospirillales bacterium]